MALATPATALEKTQSKSNPVHFDLISFPGDSLYPTGGTAAFQAFVRTCLNKGAVEIIAVIPQDCGGYVPAYDKANDKLKVYFGDFDPAAAAPLAEVVDTTDLDGVTFRVLVISK